MALRVYIHSFRAMGTTFTLGTLSDETEAYWAWRRLLWARIKVHLWERRFSRFRGDSELTRLNLAVKPRRVSHVMYGLLRYAVRAHQISGGLFDVTVLPSLEAAGYLGARPAGSIGSPAFWRGTDRYGHSKPPRILPNKRVQLGGTRIDLGGLAKGWAADVLVRRLSAAGGAFVDAGGDIAMTGTPPGHRGWLVEIEGLPGREPIAVLRLSNVGVATSSVLKRRWIKDGAWAHHIIDPRTGLPARSDLLSATVVAPRALAAEWAAKAVLIAGSLGGMAMAQAWGLAAIGLKQDRTIVKNESFCELEATSRP